MSDLRTWGARERLDAKTLETLTSQGFTTLDDLTALSPGDVKECFQDPQLLNLAQCLALKKAIERLHLGTSHPNHPAVPTPTSPQLLTYPGSSPEVHRRAGILAGTPSLPSPTRILPMPVPTEPMIYPSAPRFHGSSYSHVDGEGTARGLPMPVPQPVYGAASDGSGRMQDKPRKECFRFLLLGKTGSGKSTTGNTIFGQKLFHTGATFSSVTNDCERKCTSWAGRNIEIMDSPGLYDTNKTHEEICVNIVQAVAGMHPGPHAILYVVRMGRYTAEEYGAYQRLRALFDDNICKYMIVVFTHGDQLEKEGKTVEELLRHDSPTQLQQVMKDCNNRYIVFNNMISHNPYSQVERLFGMVREMLKALGGRPYTCPKYGHIGQGLEEEVARRLQEVEKRDLKQQKYVQQLEKETQEAVEAASRKQAEFEHNEKERQRRMEEERQKHSLLEQQLSAQIQQHEERVRQQQQEMDRIQREREEQEKRMKEKEQEMTEKEKMREAEEAERRQQREKELQALMKEQKDWMDRHREENEKQRQLVEEDRQRFQQELEEQRHRDRKELQKKEEELERILEMQRAEAARREEEYEQAMNKLKEQVVAKEETNFFDKLVNGVATLARTAMKFLFKV